MIIRATDLDQPSLIEAIFGVFERLNDALSNGEPDEIFMASDMLAEYLGALSIPQGNSENKNGASPIAAEQASRLAELQKVALQTQSRVNFMTDLTSRRAESMTLPHQYDHMGAHKLG